jgi:hypothetical protein
VYTFLHDTKQGGAAEMTNQPAQFTDEEPPESDLIWGLSNIGREAGGKTPKEMGYLLKHTTMFDGVVKRISHKYYIASRKALRNVALTARARD